MIRDLVDRNMFLAGAAWNLPPSLAAVSDMHHGRPDDEPLAFDADELETI